ncbi:RAD55 family ATPase [Halopiger xanaduensis]|uniref:TRASH domain-containing protein n=1 Tax=Halopiger xanaduensis (strain DSM 18323 / JCM 14033 / SH-6) TaxID=797210 RepID=F8DCE7_HALXS|nr:ATPase domain-containing protein [Halopiger xanaduensis]AEH38407.1 TRASH domain-containing protein [Halopiger xanaduensis SH-6]
MTEQLRTDQRAAVPFRCDHCHYPIPGEAERADDGDGHFCSTACKEAAEDDSTMPEPDAYKRVVTGIEPLDSLLPNGIPADAFVLLSGDEGTRRSELLTELVWRALERGEPAVVVSYANPPTATLERFFQNGWNVLPALEDDRLTVIDCFTHRLEDRDRFLETQTEWTNFVGEAAADALVEVEDPSDLAAVASRLQDVLDDREMSETGIVTIDSLDELDSLLREESVHNFVKDVRATVCKGRFVPIVAGATTAGTDPYPEAEYVFDGIVDLRLTDEMTPNARLKQLGVRKLIGAQFLPQWVTYEYEPVRGLFAFGPSTDAREVYENAGPVPMQERPQR